MRAQEYIYPYACASIFRYGVSMSTQPPDAPAEEAGIMERPNGTKHLSPEWAQAFLGLVRAGDTLARALDAELQEEHRISLRAFEVLLFLAVFAPDGQMRVSELAQNAPLSQSRVSRLVAELEARGLVQRSTDEHDARGIVVSVTDAGGRKFREAQETHLEGLDARLFSRLTADEIRQLATITAKVIEACEA